MIHNYKFISNVIGKVSLEHSERKNWLCRKDFIAIVTFELGLAV